MNFMRQIALGQNLTKLAGMVEEVAKREAMSPAGVDPVECWSSQEGQQMEAEFTKRASSLAKHPRHIVTEALAKHMILPVRMGRDGRAECQSRLLDMLVTMDLAMTMDEFQRSYA